MYFQKGYGGIEWILFAAFLGLITYFFFFPHVSSPLLPPSDYRCYIDPSESTSSFVDTQGDTYILLKSGAPTIRAQVDYHYAKQADIALPPFQRTYPYYKVWFDAFDGDVKPAFNPGNDPGRGGGGFRPSAGADNLRFVDVSVDYPQADRAYAIMDIYLKKGEPVPQFIIDYCALELPVLPILRIQDTDAVSFPPIEINTGNPSDWQEGPDLRYGALPLPNWRYILYAYDKKGSSSYAIGTGGAPVSTREYTFTSDGKTVTYKAYFLINSSTETISLVNIDPNAEDKDIGYKYTRYELAPQIPVIPNLHRKSPGQTNMVQYEAFVPFIIPPWGWWTPECKPAVYLYPEKETVVNIKVSITNGFLTYTDPLYLKDTGWNVLAKPSGELTYLSHMLADSKGEVNYPTNQFPYLYYEGKIQDASAIKPDTGFIKSMDELSSFFDEILPKLGLNPKETGEFKDYWLKALSNSPYYFIGIVPQETLNTNEPLTITPKEDTMIRVRLFFQGLDAPTPIQEPIIHTPTRTGFTVVDWGGMVKQDKNHPFTCVQ